jgi:hypothetical protein
MTEDNVADSVTVSYPGENAVRSELERDSYRKYLHRAQSGSVSIGDEWTESVSRGCGAMNEITLQVESVDGGSILGENTDLKFVPYSETE